MSMAALTSRRRPSTARRETWFLAFATALTTFVVGAAPADACSCYANPACSAVWRADAVFIGTLANQTEEPVGGTIVRTVQHVRVEQRLRGTIDDRASFVSNVQPSSAQIEESKASTSAVSITSTCDVRFEPGRRYIVYAHRTPDGRWTTSYCSGTKPVAEASEDLAYVASLDKAPPAGRIFGQIERVILNLTAPSLRDALPASDVRVEVASGSRRFTGTTNSEGRFDVTVPPGEYTVVAVVPSSVRLYGAPGRASVPARGCVQMDMSMVPNGRVEGRVMRVDGMPAARAQVDVISAEVPGDVGVRNALGSGTADDGGNFTIDAIVPGRYLVAANARFGPRLDAPYAEAFLAGPDGQSRRIIELGDGERQTGLTITVRPLAETTLSGVVRSVEGHPVAEASVRAASLDHPFIVLASTSTSSSGSFELRLLAGITYRLRADLYTPGAPQLRGEAVVTVDGPQKGFVLPIR